MEDWNWEAYNFLQETNFVLFDSEMSMVWSTREPTFLYITAGRVGSEIREAYFCQLEILFASIDANLLY